MGLYLHHDGVQAGERLATPVYTPPATAGHWAHLRIQVTPTTLTATRTDTGHTITATDSTVRGGYLHIGRTSLDGAAAFRHFVIS
jgi:hypothetical protein